MRRQARGFTGDCSTAAIRPKTYPVAQVTRRGDSIRLILDFLRQATEPVTTRQIALKVMAVRGLDTDDTAFVLTMRRRGGASLRNYRDYLNLRT
jgi:hypothetical protein